MLLRRDMTLEKFITRKEVKEKSNSLQLNKKSNQFEIKVYGTPEPKPGLIRKFLRKFIIDI